MPVCSECGKKEGLLAAMGSPIGEDHLCGDCTRQRKVDRAKARQTEERQKEQLKQDAERVIVTTTPGIDGYYVRRYVGIESVEYVIGTGVFSEASSALADFFGARSTAFEGKLQEAKRSALFALKFRAAEQGANAVVGVDLDYAEFGGNRVVLIANGTLVEIAPRPAR